MKNCIRQELKYVWKSKFLLLFLVLTVITSIFVIWNNCRNVSETNSSYVRLINYYKNNNLDIDEDLSKSADVIETGEFDENGDEYVQIKNPLKHYYSTLQRQIYVVSNKYVVDQFLEYGIMVFSIIFGIMGTLFSTYDIKNKTIKYKVSRCGKTKLFLTKQIVMLGTVAYCVVLSTLLNYIWAPLIRNSMLSGIEKIDAGTFDDNTTNILVKILFGIIIACVFAEAGYFFGRLFGGNIIPVVALMLYVLLLSPMGKADLKNCIYVLAMKIYSFLGSYAVNDTVRMAGWQALLGLSVYGVLFFFGSFIIDKRKSAYV